MMLMAEIGVLLYDTIITFPMEVELVWRTQLGLAAVFYALARYPLVLQLLLLCFVPPDLSSKVNLITLICWH